MWSTIYSNGKNWIKGNVELFLAFTGMIGILLAAGNQAVFWPAIQWNVLAILMCLMLILGGLRQAGGIQWVCYHLLRRCHSVKAVCAFFIFSCFISSMVITNDASLLLFVPESIWLFRKLKKDDWLPFLVVLETIAANMGSTLLPSGNPQNLYLYFMYGMKFSDFLKITVPITALSGLLILGILWGRRMKLWRFHSRRPRLSVADRRRCLPYCWELSFWYCLKHWYGGLPPWWLSHWRYF